MPIAEARLEYLPQPGFLIGDEVRTSGGSGGVFQRV